MDWLFNFAQLGFGSSSSLNADETSKKNELILWLEYPVSDLIAECQTLCVAGCCGIEAFDNSTEAIKKWTEKAGLHNAMTARLQLSHLIDCVRNHVGPVLSDEFNFCMQPGEAALCLGQWATNLEIALGFIPSEDGNPTP